MAVTSEHLAMLEDALQCLGNGPTKAELSVLLPAVFDVVEQDLESGVRENPIEHHLTVLKHAIQIAKESRATPSEIRQAAVLALLHDIAPTEKIPKSVVGDRQGDDAEAPAELEKRRRMNRVKHMHEGATKAIDRMIEVNRRLGEEVFGPEEILMIAGAIAIHDNPSLDYPIPKQLRLAVVHREADRLWMASPAGVRADLVRKKRTDPQTDPDDPKAQLRQLRVNLKRFQEERALYGENEGPFFCDTFIRTEQGKAIYEGYLEAWQHFADEHHLPW